MSGDAGLLVRIEFEAPVISWRGPSPFFFAPIPEPYVGEIRYAARAASYGWGVVPVEATVSGVAFRTSLFPKDDGYLLPLKAAVRKRARIELDDVIAVTLEISAQH